MVDCYNGDRAPVAQLDRASGYEPEGRLFESARAHHATTPTAHVPTNDGGTLEQPVDFDTRGLGRRLPKTEAPEGWVKKIERSREGKCASAHPPVLRLT